MSLNRTRKRVRVQHDFYSGPSGDPETSSDSKFVGRAEPRRRCKSGSAHAEPNYADEAAPQQRLTWVLSKVLWEEKWRAAPGDDDSYVYAIAL